MTARGINLEITERTKVLDDRNIVIPNTVRINGVEVLVPDGHPIELSDISADGPMTATITVYVGTLIVAHEMERN